jgi:hypothetical protein
MALSRMFIAVDKSEGFCLDVHIRGSGEELREIQTKIVEAVNKKPL